MVLAPGQFTTVDHIKVFRNRPDLRFEHRIHEQILPAISRAGGTVAFTDLFVVHKGSIQTPEVRQRKIARDFRILARDLEDRPDHPFVLFNLGMTHDDVGNFAEAEQFLQQCLRVSTGEETHVGKVYSLLVNSIKGQGRLEAALEVASHALTLFASDKELRFRRSIIYLDLNRLEEAARDMEQVIHEPIDRTFQSLDKGITGHKAFHNLAVIYEQLERHQDAENCWQQAIQICPEFSGSWLALTRLYLKRGRMAAAEKLQARLPQAHQNLSTRALIDALILERQGKPDEAGAVLQQTFESTGDIDCLDEAARIFMGSHRFADCQAVLQQLHELNPMNVVVLGNLATTFEAQGKQAEALSSLHKALEISPDNSAVLQRVARLLQSGTHPDGDLA